MAGVEGSSFVDEFPYLIGLILFVLFGNKGNCNQTFLFSHLIESVPPA